jgi:hypothetical protein
MDLLSCVEFHSKSGVTITYLLRTYSCVTIFRVVSQSLDSFATLRLFARYVCPFFGMEQLGSHLTDFHERDEIANKFLTFQFVLNLCIYDQFLSVFSRHLNNVVAVCGVGWGGV